MPSESPRGQVLSSGPSSADRRRSSKLGGCAGVLFQIFHGKRLFPRKSLPAERPKQSATNHIDDKLPIAKLLLIADENRSSSFKDMNEEVEVENVAEAEEAEPSKEKAPPRTISVVARLMGLESMPSPEIVHRERKQSEQHKNTDHPVPDDALQPDRRTPSEKSVQQPYSSLHRATTRGFKADLPAKFVACQREKIQENVLKSKVLSKSPSLPPHRSDSTFPSGLSSAKSGSFHKSSTRTQKAAPVIGVIGAAPKMLETNIQPNCRTRNQLKSSISRNKSGSLNPVCNNMGEQVPVDPKSQFINSAVQGPYTKRDETRPAHVAPRHSNNDTMSRRQIPDSQKSQPTQHVLGRSKCSPHEVIPVRRKHIYQGALDQQKANMSDKVKLDWQQRQEINSRLSQPTVCSALKIQRARPRHPSPPKSVQDSSGGACSSQASNCIPSPSEGPLASQLTRSHVGSNIVSAGKLSSSSEYGSQVKAEDIDDFVQTRVPLHSMYNKRADILCGNAATLQNPDSSLCSDSVKSLYSQLSQDGSISSTIYTESLQRTSMESSISSDPSLSEFTSGSEECSNHPTEANIRGHEIGEEKWNDEPNKFHDIKKATDFFFDESSSESVSGSLTASLGDTTSSHSQSDANAKNCSLGHGYSGRNAAAILQELLISLSSSTSERKSNDNKPEHAESCSVETDFKQMAKHEVLLADSMQHSEDLCIESASEDSECCNSSNSSQLSHGTTEYEMHNPITSKDSISILKMQGKDECLPEMMQRKTEIQSKQSREHADFADCEALINAISKLHHIDPETIGLSVRTTKHSNEEKLILNGVSGDGLSRHFIDSILCDDKPEEQPLQVDGGLSNSTSLTAEDDMDSIYRSDIDSSFRNDYDESAAWNKKLVTDCINEAFKSLSKQLYGFSSCLSEHSSATHVLSRVYKQLDDWRGMATSMNLDEMVEKEMNLTTRSWRNIGAETEEIAETLEGTIFSGLLEEVFLELF